MTPIVASPASTTAPAAQRRAACRNPRRGEAVVSFGPSASANSVAVPNRSLGSFASATSIAYSTSSGISRRSCETDRASPVDVPPGKGVRPMSIS